MSLLEVKDLKIQFQTQNGIVQAVRGASFHVAPGEVLAIVGESGSGKSVMTQSLLKLLPSPPCEIVSGEILFAGKDIVQLTEKEMHDIRGKEIGIIFQDAMTSLNPTMKIGKQITEVILAHENISKNEAKKKAVDLLRDVGIPSPEVRMNQHIHNLSGGMRQRVMIAIALACKPKLLIADEPTTALDVTIQSQIMDLMTDITREKDVSVILITHDLGVVASKADRIVVMYGGQPVEEGKSDAIFNHHRHPYTEGLLGAIPKLDASSEEALIPILGTPPNLLSPPKGCPFADRCRYAMKVCQEKMASKTEVNPGHYVRCHLENPLAKGIREGVDQKAKGGTHG